MLDYIQNVLVASDVHNISVANCYKDVSECWSMKNDRKLVIAGRWVHAQNTVPVCVIHHWVPAEEQPAG